MIRILFFGDIFGKPGRKGLAGILPDLKSKYNPDVVIANGENLAHGIGLTRLTIEEILKIGVDIITAGNHTWHHKEVNAVLEDYNMPLIRPANFPPTLPGRGYLIHDVRTVKLLVVNLIGRVFMKEQYDDPFRKIDEILRENSSIKAVFVDWHAEASSEKKALGWYVDGQVSAVVGTHTHTPTADWQILPGGTAFISDVGMVGPYYSVIGMDKESALERFTKQIPLKPNVAEGAVEVNAVVIDINPKTGKAEKIEKIAKIVEE